MDTPTHPPAPLSIAPMMAYTDRHFRLFMRGITRRTLLYTEMVTTGAVLHGDRERLLGFNAIEKPLALQLGGDDPAELAQCARIAEDVGFDEVNLNVGCPSDRVQRGSFGACLMLRPERVAECYAAMSAAVGVPVTVKHRIGVDDLDRYEDMLRFVDLVASAGCRRFTVHARKAWLQGLSPKENREVPPLRHDEVHLLARERPSLHIEINGGIRSLDEVEHHLGFVGGVMIGRAAWDDPFGFRDADRRFFAAAAPPPTRAEALEHYLPHIEHEISAGRNPTAIVRNILNLHAGCPGTRRWKRSLTQLCQRSRDARGFATAARRELEAVEALQERMAAARTPDSASA